MSTYTPNTPQATQTIAFTQPLIEDNFTYIDTAMKVNHTWNGNQITTEAVGSHQRLDMPNLGGDIASLPTGINAVMYAIGGNIFSYNGAKRPVSAISGTGSLTVTTTGQSVATIPNDCVGFIVVQAQNLIFPIACAYSFMTIAGTGYAQQSVVAVGSQTTIAISAASNNLTIQRGVSSGTDYVAKYKYIYWPI